MRAGMRAYSFLMHVFFLLCTIFGYLESKIIKTTFFTAFTYCKGTQNMLKSLLFSHGQQTEYTLLQKASFKTGNFKHMS